MSSFIRKHDETVVALLESGLYDVVERLNDYPDNDEVLRVGEILTLFSHLADEGRGPARRKLARMLSRYRWEARVTLTSEGFIIIPFTAIGLTKAEKWEHDAISALLRTLSEDGKPRVRPCADKGCPRWFYAAKRDDQRFCRGNCKQRNYDSDPDKRAKKAEHMRTLRAAAKRRALDPKNGVGLRVKSRKST